MGRMSALYSEPDLLFYTNSSEECPVWIPLIHEHTQWRMIKAFPAGRVDVNDPVILVIKRIPFVTLSPYLALDVHFLYLCLSSSFRCLYPAHSVAICFVPSFAGVSGPIIPYPAWSFCFVFSSPPKAYLVFMRCV